jgi:hypothetical protein
VVGSPPAATAQASHATGSLDGLGLPGSPVAPSGAAAGSPAPGGISLSFLAILMALAGLAALIFERLNLAPAAWRSVARLALLERPG